MTTRISKLPRGEIKGNSLKVSHGWFHCDIVCALWCLYLIGYKPKTLPSLPPLHPCWRRYVPPVLQLDHSLYSEVTPTGAGSPRAAARAVACYSQHTSTALFNHSTSQLGSNKDKALELLQYGYCSKSNRDLLLFIFPLHVRNSDVRVGTGTSGDATRKCFEG